MIYFATFGDYRFFGFDKIADFYVVREMGTGAQTRVRAYIAMLGKHRIFNMAKRFYMRMLTDFAIDDNAVRFDDNAITQHNLAFKYTIHIDNHIAACSDITANINAR